MAKFLTTRATASNLESIIIEAKKDLILVSPYLQLSKTLFERLKDADSRNVKLRVIYRKDNLKSADRKQLIQLKNLSLYSCEELHAKCFFNEKTMVITSMNIYAFSEINNREMGVLLTEKDDTEAFQAAVKEANSIVDLSQSQPVDNTVLKKWEALAKSDNKKQVPKPKSPVSKPPVGIKSILIDAPQKAAYTNRGYCIRCRKSIPHFTNRPLCDDCYWEWDIFGNPYYTERFCHTCGKSLKTSKAKPQCFSCY